MSSQCCPVDTYGPGPGGEMITECTCPHDCGCMCLDCICENWGEETADAP